MTAFDEITNAELAIDAAAKSSTASKFRDNPEAIMEGDPTAVSAGKGVAIDVDPGGGSQTAIITDVTDATKVLRPDGAGSVAWGDALGWTLIERKQISVAVATVDFTGLDGDTDEVYKLHGRIRKTPAGSSTFSLRPNGLTTDLAGAVVVNGAAAVTAALINFVTTGANAAIEVSFEVLIHARETIEALSQARMFQGKAAEGDPLASAFRLIDFGGMWDGVGNLVNLEIDSTLASGIGLGSTFELFKAAQA